MTNSKRIFAELKAMSPTFNEKYKPDDVVAIGLRFFDRSVEKVEAFFKDIVPTLFMCIDKQHPAVKEHKDTELQSLFICDSSGVVIYDSLFYKPSKMKMTLKLDGDRRVLAFKSLNQEQKDEIIKLTCEQVYSEIDGIGPTDDVSKVSGTPESNWGEMPWDFQK